MRNVLDSCRKQALALRTLLGAWEPDIVMESFTPRIAGEGAVMKRSGRLVKLNECQWKRLSSKAPDAVAELG